MACAKQRGNIFAACHVLLYTDFTIRLKALLDAGTIGEVISIQHLEPVGWWHQAHSFVRGNWAVEGESSFMLLAKCCHDLDWLRHVMGRPCRRVASFGSLHHFRERIGRRAPPTAASTARSKPTCPYSAKRFYLEQFDRDWINRYCVAVITDDHTPSGVTRALREGPYGRCVYACDNDVVDNQVLIMDFADGATASMTMTAFAPATHRKTRLFGTRGYLDTDGVKIEHFDFVSETNTVIDTSVAADSATAATGHGGGDFGIMQAFIAAVATGDQSRVWSGPDETLASHRIVFAAEQARREGRAVDLTAGPPRAAACRRRGQRPRSTQVPARSVLSVWHWLCQCGVLNVEWVGKAACAGDASRDGAMLTGH